MLRCSLSLSCSFCGQDLLCVEILTLFYDSIFVICTRWLKWKLSRGFFSPPCNEILMQLIVFGMNSMNVFFFFCLSFSFSPAVICRPQDSFVSLLKQRRDLKLTQSTADGINGACHMEARILHVRVFQWSFHRIGSSSGGCVCCVRSLYSVLFFKSIGQSAEIHGAGDIYPVVSDCQSNRQQSRWRRSRRDGKPVLIRDDLEEL